MNYSGTVKWFNEAKGYGFIKREDGPDLFVHYTNIVGNGFRTLKEDDKVEFEVNEGPKGLQAVKRQQGLNPAAAGLEGSRTAGQGGPAPFVFFRA